MGGGHSGSVRKFVSDSLWLQSEQQQQREMLIQSLLLSISLGCYCNAYGDPGPTSIHLNSTFQPNQTELVLAAGLEFSLSCYGNSSVRWLSTAFAVSTYKQQNLIKIRKSEPRHTGTYNCSYTNKSLGSLHTWIHIYVKDPLHPLSVFVTPRKPLQIKEGGDLLFQCLLTDPSVKNLTLEPAYNTGFLGQTLPPGMSVTFDPRKGALIQNLQMSFSGKYSCSGWKEGRQLKSSSVNLIVLPRLRHPPSLSVSQDKVIHLEGERFEVTCLSSNPSHFYNLSWTHTTIKSLNFTIGNRYDNNRLYRNNTLSVSAVSKNHSGTYTCTAVNEAGVATATTQLTVLDAPYLRVSRVSNISSSKTDVNHSSITQEVYEGCDVMLTFVIDAYPPVSSHSWITPAHVSNYSHAAHQESYTTNGYRSKASLLLWRVRPEDRGRYSFNFSNRFLSSSQNIDLRIYRSPSVVITQKHNTVTCSTSGYPLPTILFYICRGIQEKYASTICGNTSVCWCANVSTYEASSASEEEEARTYQLPSHDDVTVKCVASNAIGEARDILQLGSSPVFFTPALVGALSAAAVLLLLLLLVLYKWRQKPKYEIRWKIIESINGNNYTFVDPTQLPYNHKWEFPRDKLRLGAVLGSGAFGKVVEATAYGLGTNGDITTVAVKMLKPRAHLEERDALMSELKILSHLGYHDNIVNLLGACTQGGPMLMITEYCSHGDLLNFLRCHAQDFMVSVLGVNEAEEEMFYKNLPGHDRRMRSDSGISCCSEYQDMQPVQSPQQTQRGLQKASLSLCNLVRFSYDVAQGLDFLSSKNCIHRDVAARNVLLTDRRVAKICDFGLARDIRNDDSYIVQGNSRLPVKWMAPESIFQCVYTLQSDVWSYGVLLWEIFSLGKSPYPNVAVDTKFYTMIMEGRHMCQPDFAPAQMYQLMTLCWSLEPTDRPNFKMIGQLINRLLHSTDDTLQCHSCHMSYQNVVEGREEEEAEEEEMLKQGQEEHHHDDKEKEPMMKNIYKLS
ncbi:macrophage colony-stimulating factor 1 receptor 2 [Betta splendens]|uniref:receptor protein-tyrosine kinase n=1 Tax=Betta splendens TaxID=158456 RepID=A0A6P7PP24_BETSP|nr:macrophage colony-stimulating factor 1 receptor 2 [Betta splendens]